MKKETKDKLISAFIALSKRKRLDDMSISELTTLATINRGTFYLTYEDFNGFILSLEKDLLIGFKEQLFHRAIDCGLGDGMVDVFNYIHDNMSLFKVFMLDQVFVKKFEASIDAYIETYHQFNATIPIDYSRAILLNATLAIIKLWIFEPKPRAVADITEIFYKTRTIAPIDLVI